MSLERSVPTDNRLDDMPMLAVTCGDCGAQVLARKASWNQTSVQWNADAVGRCAQRREVDCSAGHRGVFLACSALRDSIEEAARTGELTIVQIG